MKRSTLVLSCLLFGTACGCEPPAQEPAPLVWRAGGPAVCDAGILAPAVAVDAQLHTIGASPNIVYAQGEYAWITESGENTVSRVVLETGALDAGFVDVGNNRGPWDVRVDEGLVFITNYTGKSLTVADAETGEVLEELPGLEDASGIAVTPTHVFVTSVNYDPMLEDDFGPGSVTVIARDGWEVLGEIETRAKNPIYAGVIPGTEQIMIVSAGAVGTATYGDATGYGPQTDGAVEIWTPGVDVLEPAREVFEVPFVQGSRRGALGAPVWSGRYVYFASATAPEVFKLDLMARAWARGPGDPIVLYETDSDALHHATIDPRGILYVTSFNDDRMFLVDTACDQVLGAPVELGAVPDLLEGPHGAVARSVGTDRTEVHFITSVSGVLGKVMFDFSEETP